MNGVWFWRDALRSDAEALGCSPCDMNRTGRLVPFSQKQPRSKGPKGASDGAQKPGGAGRPSKSQSGKGDAAAPRVLTVTIKRNAGVVKRVRTVVGRATVVRLPSASKVDVFTSHVTLPSMPRAEAGRHEGPSPSRIPSSKTRRPAFRHWRAAPNGATTCLCGPRGKRRPTQGLLTRLARNCAWQEGLKGLWLGCFQARTLVS